MMLEEHLYDKAVCFLDSGDYLGAMYALKTLINRKCLADTAMLSSGTSVGTIRDKVDDLLQRVESNGHFFAACDKRQLVQLFDMSRPAASRGIVYGMLFSMPSLLAAFILLCIFPVVWLFMSSHLPSHSGLTASFYDSRTFVRPLRKQQVETIDFDWAERGPFEGAPSDFFTVQWNGYLFVSSEGRYEFELSSDDGSKLWLSDSLLIDNSGAHSFAAKTAAVHLSHGEWPIKVEFTELKGDARIRLRWKRPGELDWSLIPADSFRRSANR